MNDAFAIEAPAKLNLGLRVLGRRPDGYHELATIFVAIDLCDELVMRRRSDRSISLELVSDVSGGLPVTAGEDNLAVRAARLFLEQTKLDGGFDLHLRKRIPAGGGLGGGSADAAAVLTLAQFLTGRSLSANSLAAIGLELGADVPFFLVGPYCHGATCFARGIGEQLFPIEPRTRTHFLLVLAGFGKSTPAVFRSLAARLIDDDELRKLRDAQAPTAMELAAIEADGNELEQPAMRCTPDLQILSDGLRRHGLVDLRMTGSGSTLFVACADRAAVDVAESIARRALVAIPPAIAAGLRFVRASTLRSPLTPRPVAWPKSEVAPWRYARRAGASDAGVLDAGVLDNDANDSSPHPTDGRGTTTDEPR